MIFSSLKKTFMTGCITLSATNFVYANTTDQTELNTTLKEDIIAAQILLEICPAVVSNKDLLQQNITNFSQDALKQLSPSFANLTALQQDAEYKSLYQNAKKESAGLSAEEIKSECESALTIHEESLF